MSVAAITKKLDQLVQQTTPAQLLLVLLIAGLYFFLLVNLQLLPIYATMMNNADVLFIEDAARGLQSGGNLFDWRLTQAPYIFPDIFAAWLLVLLGVGVGKVAVVYHVLYGGALCACAAILTRLSQSSRFLVVCSAVLLYAASYFGGLSQDAIGLYFGLIGHHSGVALPVMAALMATMLYMQRRVADVWSLGLLFVAVFLGVISDSIVLLAILPCLTLYLLLALWRGAEPRRRLLHLLAFAFAAALLGKAFSFTNPFPQDQEFMRWVLGQFPKLTLDSVKKFPEDFAHYMWHSRASALIALAYLTSLLVAARHLWAAVRKQAPVDSATLLSLFVIISPLLTIVVQIVIGLYGSIDSSRQWAALLYIATVCGPLIAARHEPNRRRIYAILLVLTMLLLLHVTIALHKKKGETPNIRYYAELIDCMEKTLPSGWLYIADYWAARPIRFYSEGRFGVVPFSGLAVPFTNAGNVALIRKAAPRYVITGYSIDYAETVKTFGTPKAEYCAVPVQGVGTMRVLDYGDNQAVMNSLQEKAAKAY